MKQYMTIKIPNLYTSVSQLKWTADRVIQFMIRFDQTIQTDMVWSYKTSALFEVILIKEKLLIVNK